MTQDREASRQIRRPQVVEHLDHPAMRRNVALRTARDLDDDVVALACPVRQTGRHVDGVPMTGVFRFDTSHALHRMPNPADAHWSIARPANQTRDAAPAVVYADG